MYESIDEVIKKFGIDYVLNMLNWHMDCARLEAERKSLTNENESINLD